MPQPRPPARDVLARARELSERAIELFAELMESDDPKTSMAAASAILDRAWGKPATASGEPETPDGVTVIERRIVDAPDAPSPDHSDG